MNLLALQQAFSRRNGLPIPSSIIGNPDAQVQQVYGLLCEVLEDLSVERGLWANLAREATFVTVAAEDQGAITTIAGPDFKFVVNDTIFNRTTQLPLYGPTTASRWQQAKALTATGPFYKWRLVRQHILFNPAPVAGETCAFEYASRYLVLDVDGTTRKEYPGVDTDTFLLDHVLILAGLRWKWKYEKGLDYAEDFRRYETLAASAKIQESSAPILSMNGCEDSAQPGIFVPPGSWPL